MSTNEAPTITIDSDGLAFLPGEAVTEAPRGVVNVNVADVDNDGDLDLVVGTYLGDPGVYVMLNDGTGSFTLGAQITENLAWRTMLADLDGDGNVDFASVDHANETTVWYKGNGDGTFGTAQQLAAGTQHVIAAADLDADGDLDVVTLASGAINMQENNGDGSFSEVAIATGVTGVYSVAIGDLDGDGSLDFVATTSTADFVAYLGDGNGGFTTADSQSLKDGLGLRYGLENVKVADIDGDGNLDAVAISANDQGIYLLRGNGDGTFSDAEVVASGRVGGLPPTVDFKILDINGDGKVDIVAPSMGTTPSGGGTLSWFEQKTDGSFEEHVIESAVHTTASEFVNIATDDFNGDGAPDLLSSGDVRDSGGGATSYVRIASGSPSLLVNENADTAVTGVSFADDLEGPVVVTFSVDRGTLSAVTGGGVTVGGTETEVTLTGTVADINAFISGGNLTFLTDLHDETAAVLTVSIDDQDPDAPATTTTELLLAVEPMFDEAPTDVSIDNVTVAEDAAVGTVIGTLSATDPEGGAVTFSLVSNPWGVVSLDGDKLVLGIAVDHEAQSSYDVVVRATDVGGEITDTTITITVGDVNEAPTNVALSNAKVIEDSPAGTVVGTLSATDPDTGETLTYSIANDSGAFEIVDDQLVVKDLGGVLSHSVTVVATDSGGLTTEKTFKIVTTDADGNPLGSAGTITIDASTATAGIDFEAFIRGGFIADAAGGGFPVFDNGAAFSGEEMFIGYGTDAASKYVFAHGELEYYFGTHTVAGTINTIQYGTRGEGTYDADGYFHGGAAELTITGLGLNNPIPANGTEEAEIEANGPVHNFAVAYMYGATADQARLDKYADSLDDYAQHFVGSAFDDVFTGSAFNDVLEGGAGNDSLYGGGGNDEITGGTGTNTIEGGDGVDTYVVDGNRADYDLYIYSSATYLNVKSATDYDTLKTMEYVRFNDVLVNLVTKEETPIGGDLPPTGLALSSATVAENALVGAVVGILSATDPEGQPLTYTLTDDAGGLFEIVGNELRVKAGLDYETAPSHGISVKVSDGVNEVTEDFTVAVTDVDESGPVGSITIDARGSDGIDFDAFILGGFLADTAGGGFPVFDNGAEFSGEEMMIGFGTDAASKYVLAHGDIEYFFGSHTVHGTINTIEYGTRGSGTYDANGYFTGGDAALKITGLDLFNGLTPEAEVEATGAVHNFSVAHMYGSAADPARLALFAEQLDAYAQTFLGSEGNDAYVGTRFGDTINGGGGEDILAGGGGNDNVDGGEGVDTFVFTGNYADYGIVTAGGVTTVTDRRSNPADGVATLRNIELLQFVDQQVALVSDLPPVGLALSATSVVEDAGIGSVVAVLSANDPEGGAVTYALSADADQKFEIVGDQLRLKAGLDFETKSSHEIAVTVSDAGGNTSTKTFTIEVTDVLEPTIAGKEGKDKIKGTKGDDVIFGYGGKDKLKGGKGDDILDGGAGKDKLVGGKGDDTLIGGAGKDKLNGGKGDDILIGGAGKDVLKGGKGADTFVFQFASDSTVKGKGRDVIQDFNRKQGDKIDLSAIDPLNDSGAFDYIGKSKFSGEAGELHYQKKGGKTLISGDIDGDGKADFAIQLSKAMNMKEADFIL